MKTEHIGPTATLAAAILSKLEPEHHHFTREILASAFEDAYLALMDGIQRVDRVQDEAKAQQMARIREESNQR